MKTLESTRKTLLILSLVCLAPLASQANLVVNGGFETGNFSGWTLVDPSGFSNVGNDPAFAHSGTYHANLGTFPVPPGPSTSGSLSQNLATTAGSLYTLSFWLANDYTAPLSPVNSFQVYWNGGLIFALANAAPFPYTQFTFGNLAATGPATSLQFVYQHDSDFFRLDDVTVNVPESGSAILMALPVFAALGLVHFRMRAGKRFARA